MFLLKTPFVDSINPFVDSINPFVDSITGGGADFEHCDCAVTAVS
jgi:hypothetical protein